jgi:CheY-like chemotaxis protein
MILLAENDENDVYILGRVLQKLAWNEPVHLSPNGQDALNYLEGAGDYPNRLSYPIPSVIFLDLELTLVHRLNVLEWISSQPSLSTIPVIILSSSPRMDDLTKTRDLKTKFYFVKPPDVGKIQAAFQSIFGPGCISHG